MPRRFGLIDSALLGVAGLVVGLVFAFAILACLPGIAHSQEEPFPPIESTLGRIGCSTCSTVATGNAPNALIRGDGTGADLTAYAGTDCVDGAFVNGLSPLGAATCESSISGNAGTATALATNGSNCTGPGEFAKGVSASGAAEGCAVPTDTDTWCGSGQTCDPADVGLAALTADQAWLGPSYTPTLVAPAVSASPADGCAFWSSGALDTTGVACGSGGGGGVTSVGLALPAEFNISGSPVTASGTLTGAWASAAQRSVLAGPTGGAGTPAFRALSLADVGEATQEGTGNLVRASGSISGNAATATALGSNPQDCIGSNFANAIAANGDLTCATPALSGITATAGAGIAFSSNTVQTQSDETGFLIDADLTCGAGTKGRAAVDDAGSTLEWCDDSATPTLRFAALGDATGKATTAGAADTAAALASNPTDCDPGDFATAIAANGNLTCDTPPGSTDTWCGSGQTCDSADVSLDPLDAGEAWVGASETPTLVALVNSAAPSDGCAQFSSGVLASTGSACGSGGGGGSVTSVGLALPTDVFDVTGSPVVGSGTLTGAFDSQSQKTVFAAPNGSSGTPSFRQLQLSDLTITAGAGVNISSNTVLTASDETGFLLDGTISCGAGTKGKLMLVDGSSVMTYCDDQATPTQQYIAKANSTGVATTALAFDSDPSDCSLPNLALGVDAAGGATCAQPSDVTGNAATATALSGNPSDCTLPQVALGIVGSGAATCAQPSDVTGNAATSTALASDPADCGANAFATAIATDGDLTCATPALSTITASAGAGISFATNAIQTQSDETGFLLDADLTCGAGTKGKAAIDDGGSTLEWCDDTATPVLRFAALGDATGKATTAGAADTAAALAANPSPCSLPQVVTDIAADGTLTCQQPTSVTGNAATATALAGNPDDCSAGNYATAIATSGNLTCAQVALSELNATAGAGIAISTNTLATASDETSFLADTTLTCGAGTKGRLVVDNGTTVLTYCDDQSTPAQQYVAKANSAGVASSASALAGNGGNCSLPQVALGVDTAGAGECAQPSDVTGNAATATALAGDPADCSASHFATAIATDGDLTCAQPTLSDLTITAGAGIAISSNTIATASDESGFVLDGTIACGAGTKGKLMLVDGSSVMTYCDDAGTPAQQYVAKANSSGVATTALALNSEPADCSADKYALGVDTSGVAACSSALGAGQAWVGATATPTDIFTEAEATTALAAKVTGPASATDNALVRFDGTTGKLVKDSAIPLTTGTSTASGSCSPTGSIYIETDTGILSVCAS